MKNIVVIGSANADMVIHTAAMPKLGETRTGHDFQQNAGGKGLNQAVAIAKLGGDVTFVGAVGTDANGAMLLTTLQEHGVAFDGIQTADIPTGVAMITVVNGDNSIIVNSGANAAMTPAVIDTYETLIAQSDYCVLQLEIPVETVVRICEIAAAHDTNVVLNPAPYRELPASVYEKVTYCVPNEHEAAALIGTPITDEATAIEAVKTLHARGIPHVVMTWGGNGCVYNDGDTVVRHRAESTAVVDTTSAGDCFIGAMVARLAQGDELADAIAYASKAAAIAVSREGAAKSIPYAWEVSPTDKS